MHLISGKNKNRSRTNSIDQEDTGDQPEKDSSKFKNSFESKLNSFYQNIVENTPDCITKDLIDKLDKKSLISTSSSSVGSANSVSIKMQSDSPKGPARPFLVPKAKPGQMSSLLPSKHSPSSQPELNIRSLGIKKTGYVFDSAKLVAKPLEIEDTNAPEMTDEERPAGMSRDQKKNYHHIYVTKGGKLTFSKNKVYDFNEKELEEVSLIGNGEFGTVLKVLHRPTGKMMALKRVGPTVGNQGERKKVLKELAFVLECHEYEYIVNFYGVKFNNEPADCLICMELMDASLDKFYKYVYNVREEELPESFLAKVCVATVNALNYLKENHKIIHRDVKPSNILINRQGDIKMCDFGISGKLVDSIAASRDAGSQFYMAPERIDPYKASKQGYDIRSDVWSLGITLYELSTGKFPYPQWKSIFHQLSIVVEKEAPRLQSERLSEEFKNFTE
ncbi:dual specificity mitogen-activated kinase kinase 4 isoform X1 [Brachionus plicatilis]|uniref:mitogen-activated protein kinase kinase n=1 Tax=Brachionus plicatilis TaxID=10195 RepID=A0A3M7Q399_BRAPC|nr:dual specificity mitogen-activated kinase kinase 4 isoform X1 [Brachionus plicatilis]